MSHLAHHGARRQVADLAASAHFVRHRGRRDRDTLDAHDRGRWSPADSWLTRPFSEAQQRNTTSIAALEHKVGEQHATSISSPSACTDPPQAQRGRRAERFARDRSKLAGLQRTLRRACQNRTAETDRGEPTTTLDCARRCTTSPPPITARSRRSPAARPASRPGRRQHRHDRRAAARAPQGVAPRHPTGREAGREARSVRTRPGQAQRAGARPLRQAARPRKRPDAASQTAD